MLVPKNVSDANSKISHKSAMAKAKQKENSATKNGLSFRCVLCDLLRIFTSENPPNAMANPLVACNILSNAKLWV